MSDEIKGLSREHTLAYSATPEMLSVQLEDDPVSSQRGI